MDAFMANSRFLPRPRPCFLIALIIVALVRTVWAYESIDIAQAYLAGRVRVSARAADGYSKTRVSITNTTDEVLRVSNFPELGFVPETSKAQRIGIPVSRSYAVDIEPGTTTTLLFDSRCLDSGRPSPVTGEFLLPLEERLPPYLVGPLAAGASQQQVWSVTNGTNRWDWKLRDSRNIVTVRWTIYNRTEGAVMTKLFVNVSKGTIPTTAPVLIDDDGQATLETLCPRDEGKVCYGAGNRGSDDYWGAGMGGDMGCASCCYVCDHDLDVSSTLVP
jgi:hypothetical protein